MNSPMDTPRNINQKMARAFLGVAAELEKESDRGCVVLAVAWIEDELTGMLKKFCLPSLHRASEKSDELFGPGRALGDFATKIDLAYRLGLIRKERLNALHLCRRVRNDFAHLSSALSFETPAICNRVREIFDCEKVILNAMWSVVRADESLSAMLGSSSPDNGYQALLNLVGIRKLFELTAATMVSGLMLACREVKSVETLEAHRD